MRTSGWARKDSPPDDIPADRIAATEAVRVRDEALMRRLVRNQTRHMEALQKDLQQVAMQRPNLHTERQARGVAAIRQRFAEPIRKMEKRHKSWLGRVGRVAFGKGRQAHAMERLTGKRDQAIGRKLHLQAESEARRQIVARSAPGEGAAEVKQAEERHPRERHELVEARKVAYDHAIRQEMNRIQTHRRQLNRGQKL